MSKLYIFLLTFLIVCSLFAQLNPALDTLHSLMPPCNVPPFLSESITPNVMMIIDNSGSMNYDPWSTSYDPTKDYYGYADPDSFYQYNSATKIWEPTQTWTGTADFSDLNQPKLCGNAFNFIYNRRIDNLRKVMTGGEIYDKVYAPGERLIQQGEKNRGNRRYRYIWADDGCRYKLYMDNSSDWHSMYYIYRYSSCNSGSWQYKKTLKAYFRIRSNYTTDNPPSGIIQKVYDKVKLGLMHFHDNEGGYVKYACGAVDVNTYVNQVNTMYCDTWTPLAETYYEATKYFQATNGVFNSIDYGTMDPLDGWCQKCFVILVTDGESTKDRNIPAWLRDYDNDGNDPGAWGSDGSDYLDDIALWSHTTDLRTDFENEQTMQLYTIYVFGTSEKAIGLLSDAAKNGAFDDKNANNIPDLAEEYDADGNGVPDAFFNAENGYLLENALTDVFVDLLKRAASSSAVSVVSSTSKGQGMVFQAFFQPSKFIGSAQLSWIGNLHSLWIDPYGNLREDTDEDGHLDMEDDYIARIHFDAIENKTIIDLYEDTDGDGEADVSKASGDLDIVHSLWRAGDELLTRSASSRNIYAIKNTKLREIDTSGTIESEPFSSATWEFKTSTAPMDTFTALFDVSTSAVAESLVDYIRGVDYAGIRTRSVGSDVWKLGDIINSTPIFVGPPGDRYDLIYNDASYRTFFQQYKDRRPIVYVGANDGMLHAFNAGTFVETYSGQDKGYIDGNGNDLGEEMWSVIPYNLLPHLKWLCDPNYCHVYYVDGSPKVFDAQIFDDDPVHPNGWGTVLVVGMRFGGSDYSSIVHPGHGLQFVSSIMCLDITNPDQPGIIMEGTADELDFTTVKMGVANVSSNWFLLIGSGPSDFVGLSEHHGIIYVMNLNDGEYVKSFTLPENHSHLGDISTVDVDIDQSVDVIYFGVSIMDQLTANWSGKIYRLVTNESSDLDDWELTTLINVPGPITAAPVATIDDIGNVWVYAGTGRYFSDQDEQDLSQQFVFGVKDPYWSTGSDSLLWDNLYNISNATVQQTDTGTFVYGLDSIMSYSTLLTVIQEQEGWRNSLPHAREKVISTPILIGGVLFFTTFVPSEDICAFGGSSALYGVDYLTGVPGETSILGMDEDGWLFEFVELGEGVPSAPAAHIGLPDDAKILVQLATSSITQTSASIKSPKSRGLFWRGK